jgi:hypothetical protein
MQVFSGFRLGYNLLLALAAQDLEQNLGLMVSLSQ